MYLTLHAEAYQKKVVMMTETPNTEAGEIRPISPLTEVEFLDRFMSSFFLARNLSPQL